MKLIFKLLLLLFPISTLLFNQLNASGSKLLYNYNDLLKGEYYKDYGFSHFTRYNLEHMQDGTNRNDATNPIANFSGLKILDLPAAIDNRPGVFGQKMNVWDSWPLQDGNGNVVDYKGYHITFVLTGNPNKDYTSSQGQAVQDTRIFVYYQKIGQEKFGVKSWHSAGELFKNPQEGNDGKDKVLNQQVAQWSGNSIIFPNNDIRIFYTSFNGILNDDWQSIATSKIVLKVHDNRIIIDHKRASDHKTILVPDGKIYQKESQTVKDAYDENVFRDAHFFKYHNKNYLIFSASAGPSTGPEGLDVLRNVSYIGGNKYFRLNEYALLDNTQNNPWHIPATEYNAVFGIAELNNNFTVNKLLKPVLGLNTVTDEFERPSLFEHNGKWYLFGVSRGYKLLTPNVNPSDSFLIGFVGNSPFGPFKPLNKNGLVIRNTRKWDSRYYTYSFYVLNNNGKGNRFLVTSYMNNAKVNKYHMTFSPTMILEIKDDKTKIIRNDILSQGATTISKVDHIK